MGRGSSSESESSEQELGMVSGRLLLDGPASAISWVREVGLRGGEGEGEYTMTGETKSLY